VYPSQAFGTLAIDLAIVGETSGSIIEQKLTANIAPHEA